MTQPICIIATGDRNADYQTWRPVIKDTLSEFMGRYGVLVHGGQRGIDLHAGKIAGMHGWQVLPVFANFVTEGKPAGPRRNRGMARVADILQDHGYEVQVHAFHDDFYGVSTGTVSMSEIAQRYGFPVTLHTSDGGKEQI